MKQVLLDTNFLRELFYINVEVYNHDEVSEFKKLLKNKDVIVLVSNHVVIELLCNLLKETEDAKSSSFFALSSLSYLSINKTERDVTTRGMSPGFQAIYCYYFYGKLFEQISKNEHFINTLFYSYLNDKANEEVYLNLIRSLKSEKESELIQFLNNIENFIKKLNSGLLD